MAQIVFLLNCKRTLNKAIAFVGKYRNSVRYIMATSNSFSKAIETLEKNPYYNKYTDKIAALQKEKPETFLSRWEDYQENMNVKPSEEKPQQSSSMKPKSNISKSSIGSTKMKVLNDIMKVDLVKDKTKEEISKIWHEYFKSQDGLAASVSKEIYNIIQEKSRAYPIFVFPLPKSEGYEFIMCQFDNNEAHFTNLINYHTYKENAPECLTLVYFTDIMEDKGLVLMRGEFDKNVLGAKEAICLSNQLQLYYGQNDEKRDHHLQRFTHSPDDFNYIDLIAELECLTLK